MHLFHQWKREAKHVIQSVINDKRNSTNIIWMDNSEFEIDYPLIDCKNVYDVTKVIGELKSYFGSSKYILFRGQVNHYNFSQKPKILRGKNTIEDVIPANSIDINPKNSFYDDFLEKLQDFTFAIKKEEGRFDSRDLNFFAWEPVLQHYGIKSRYIDLVDNLNTAFWFSIITWDLENNEFCISDGEYSYLFVYLAICNTPISKGVFDGPDQRLVNLREALPAFALRPHIQQGFLLANHEFISFELDHYRNTDPKTLERMTDYNRFVLCSIRIKTNYLMEYLGICKKKQQVTSNYLSLENYKLPQVFSKRTIFPDPDTDELFKLLLHSQYKFDKYYDENRFEEISTLELLSEYLKGDDKKRQELEIQLQKAFLGDKNVNDVEFDSKRYLDYLENSIYDLLAWTGQFTYDIGRIEDLGYETTIF